MHAETKIIKTCVPKCREKSPISHHPIRVEEKKRSNAQERKDLVTPSLVVVQMSLSTPNSRDNEGARRAGGDGNLLLNPEDLVYNIALGLILGAVEDLLGSLGKLRRSGGLRGCNRLDDSTGYARDLGGSGNRRRSFRGEDSSRYEG